MKEAVLVSVSITVIESADKGGVGEKGFVSAHSSSP